MEQKDVVIIGGGPAGLAAAVELHKQGIRNMIILEREAMLGGILRQCIHDGFGLGRFGESLSGPEYAQAFIDEVNKREIPYETSATVLSLTADRVVTASTRSGLRQYQAKAVVLAMGCKERSRGALGIPGERPAGVFTAGTAQAYMNLYNRMPGKEVVILGSGDIGMIMARRMTLEGAHVQAVFELMPYPSGLPRNIVQCLDDYNIPLYLSHTVTEIHGRDRLTGVTISEVDANRRPIPGTEKEYKCDTLILSVGLIPENKLLEDAGIAIDPHTNGAVVDENLQTNVPGVFSAGNVLHVHDLVDFVSMESEALARHAAAYVEGKGIDPCTLDVKCGEGVGHTIPQKVSGKNDFSLSLRVRNHYRDCRIVVRQNKLLEDAGIAIDPHTNGAVVDENLQTNVPGVFSAGNVLHVHDLVDFVSMESEALARHAAAYVEGKGIDPCTLDVKCGEGVGHTIPQKVSGKNDFSLSLRVRNHYRDCRIVVRQNGVEVAAKKMKKAIPAEMIQFKVSAAKLQETGALEVSVE